MKFSKRNPWKAGARRYCVPLAAVILAAGADPGVGQCAWALQDGLAIQASSATAPLSAPAEYTTRQIVRCGSSVDVKADEAVGEIIVVGSAVRVAGYVNYLSVVGGSLTLLPTARVRELVCVGSAYTRAPGAVVERSEQTFLSGQGFPAFGAGIVHDGEGHRHPLLSAAAVAVLVALLVLVFGLVLVLASAAAGLFPGQVLVMREYVRRRPGASLCGGMLATVVVLLGFLAGTVLLLVSLIGIPLLPFFVVVGGTALIGLVLTACYGSVAVFSTIGWLAGPSRDRPAVVTSVAAGVVCVAALTVFLLLLNVWYLGWLTLAATLLFLGGFFLTGLGAALLTAGGLRPVWEV